MSVLNSLPSTYLLLHLSCLLALSDSQPAKLPLNATMPTRIGTSTFNSTRKTISILAMVNYGGSVYNLGPLCTEGIKMALDSTKKVARNLENYELVVETVDDQCVRQFTVGKFANEMQRNGDTFDRISVMTGPQCTGHSYTGQMLQHFNFVGLEAITGIPDITKRRNVYRNFFLLGQSLTAGYQALAQFLQMMSWRKVAIIGENSVFFNEAENILISAMDTIQGRSEVVGVVKMPYISGTLLESSYIQTALDELRPRGARIILVDSVSTARVACWLHRYKMFGPNHVILLYSVYSFQADDPSRFSPWCTVEMLKQVLQSVFIFGNSNEINLFGPNTEDSTGMTGKQFEANLLDRIESPKLSPHWWFWRTTCYDNTLAAGYLLDETERNLRKRNETLSDWFVSGQHFQQNGSEFVEIVKESLFSAKFKTLAGEIMFERNTTVNGGLVPIAIFQMQDGVAVPIAIQSSQSELKVMPGKMKWRTTSGRPPNDSVFVVQVLDSAISKEIYIIITVISALLLAVATLTFVYQIAWRNKNPLVANSVPAINVFILFGDIFSQLFTLVPPWMSTPTSHFECMASYGCLFVGMACLLSGLASKSTLMATAMYMERSRNGSVSAQRRKSSSHSRRNGSRSSTLQNLSFEGQVTVGVVVCIGTTLTVATLSTALFVVEPFRMERVNSSLVALPDDDSQAYQYYHYECRFGDSKFSLAIIGTMFSYYAAMLIRSGFLAYATRHSYCQQIVDSRHTANCLYGTVVMLGCGGIIAGAIFANNPTNMHLTISFTLFLLSGLNLCTVFAPQLAKPSNNSQDAVLIATLHHHYGVFLDDRINNHHSPPLRAADHRKSSGNR